MKKYIASIIMLFSLGEVNAQCATNPSISAFSPLSGEAGTLVTITGSGFDPVAANNIIFFGNVKATPFSATSTSLQVNVPAGATAQYLAVNKSCGGTAMLQYGFRITNPCAGPIAFGAFSSPTLYNAWNRGYSAALGDLDGDGKLDMAVANYNNPTNAFNPTRISIYWNQSTPGTISYSDSVGYAVGPTQLYGIYIFDIDMDGKMDVIAQSTGNALSIFRNISTTPGTIALAAKVDITPGSGSWAMTFGDMDGDSKPDLIYGGTSQATIVRNLSTPGNISFAAPFVVQMNPSADFCNTTDVKVADLDGDGRNDIVTANYNCSKVGVCRNLTSTPGAFSFDTYFTYTSSGQTHGVAIADLNNDGKPEIIAGNRSIGITHIFQNQNSGTLSAASFMAPVDLPSGASTVLVQDMTGDGKPDVLLSNGGAVTIYNNSNATGATITSAAFGTGTGISLSCGGTARMFDIGDVDGDGYLDMVSGRDASSPGAKAEVVRRLPSPGFNALVASTTASTTNCDASTWKNIYDPITRNLIASVKDNGLGLGTITATAYVDATAGNVNGSRSMRRHYVISTGSNPAGTKRVRIYYTSADFADLQSVVPGLTNSSQLVVTKYSGPGEDGVYNPDPLGTLVYVPSAQITTTAQYGQGCLEFDVTGFSEFWIHTGANVLPLELLSFTAVKKQDRVQLDWKTTNETNVSHFSIEKSFDGSRFTSIGSVTATNNSNGSTYSFADQQSNQPVVYYRLQVVDKDGKFKYSPVARIRFDNKMDISIAPNPAKDIIKISSAGQVIQLQLVSMSGQLIRSWAPASNSLYDVSNVANGIYLLKIKGEGTMQTEKLVVRH